MAKVLISEKISRKAIDLLVNAGFEVKISPSTNEEIMKAEIKDADAVVIRATPLTKSIIESGKNLKIISRHGTGVDNIDIQAATEQGILVTRVNGANAYSVAEYVLTSMLALSRRLYKSDKLFKAGSLSVNGASLPGLANKYDLNGHEIRGKKLVILGFGRIGRILADLAEGLGVEVVAYDPYVKEANIPLVTDLEDSFKTADFISINMPLTPETKDLITKKELRTMKTSSFIINAGRGGIINEGDLADALNQGVIAGAALDVFYPEPPQNDNPLLTAKNVILTCHIAGTTFEATEALGYGAAESIIDYFNGEMPKFPINQEEVKRFNK